MYHIPVLLNESVAALDIKPDGVYVDCTFGGGGHTTEILHRLGKKGKVYCFDRDIDARKNAIDDSRFVFVRGNFKHIKNFLRYYKEDKIDGILADLGVSSHHFDNAERGFSYRYNGELDMRMNQSADFNAKEMINNYSCTQLSDIFYQYGELRNARKIASAIVRSREEREIKTIFDMIEVVKPFCNKSTINKDLSPIFQAIRIEVNDELGALKALLLQSVNLLKAKGRIAIISYHSLEDRLVKNFFKTGNFSGILQKDFYGNPIVPLKNISNKAIVSTDEEQKNNTRSRSAKLRIAEKQN